ncbi:MAG: hypothetical protein IJJ44_10900 [Solobacterium sp.]|nr:hypothetical protein [Solobacterium sp.]
MKKSIGLLCISMMLCLVLGCGSDTSSAPAAETQNASNPETSEVNETAQTEEKEFYDEDFLSDFSKAIQARWDLNDKNGSLSDVVNAELDIISVGDYRNKKYKDSHLAENVLIYLNALDKQKELLGKNNGDISAASEEDMVEWSKTANKRYEIIADLYDNYNLSIDSKHSKAINKTHNQLYISKYGPEAFENMLNEWEIEEDGETIRLTVKNKTQYAYKDIGIEVFASIGNEYKGIVFSSEFTGWDPDEKKIIEWTVADEKAIGINVEELKEGELINIYLGYY